MSHDTEKLEREVENRRSTVESTIEELRSRMSVGQIMDEFSGYMKDGQASEMAQNFGRQVRDNPLALGLVGAGIAWLFMGNGVRDGGRRIANRYGDWRDDARGDGEPHYPDYRGASADARQGVYPGDVHSETSGYAASSEGVRYSERMPYKVGGSGQVDYDDTSALDSGMGTESPSLADRARSVASGLKDTISDGAASASSGLSSAASGISSAAGRVGSAASSVGDSAGRYGRSAAEAAWRAEQAALGGARYAGQGAARLGSQAKRTFVETLQDEPLVLGAIAVAIGAAVGASLPSTRVEDEYLGETRDRLRDQAYGYGKDALESAKHVAEETYKSASEAADEKGLKPSTEGETLAEKVSSVVRAATDTAKSEAKKEGLV